MFPLGQSLQYTEKNMTREEQEQSILGRGIVLILFPYIPFNPSTIKPIANQMKNRACKEKTQVVDRYRSPSVAVFQTLSNAVQVVFLEQLMEKIRAFMYGKITTPPSRSGNQSETCRRENVPQRVMKLVS